MGAPFEIRLDIRHAAALAKALAAAPDIYEQEMTAATWEAEMLAKREIQEATPTGVGAGGGLRGSIDAREPEIFADTVIGVVGTPLAYAVPVELGTRPHFPPIEPLTDWVRAKLGVSDNEAPGVAFRIALKISRKGTEGAHMFQRGFDAVEPQVTQIYAVAIERMAQRMEARS